MTRNSATKSWYRSKTVWGGVVAAGAGIVGAIFHFSVNDATQVQLVDSITAIAGGVGGLIAIYGRVKAKKQIG